MTNNNTKVEIWGDVIGIKDLIISILISAIFTMGGYFLASSNDRIRQLFYGLLGAVIGFIISTLLVKPKRIITFEETIEEDKEK